MRYLTVRTENLTKAYGLPVIRLPWHNRLKTAPAYALHNLSLDIEPGEVFGLLGPSGAGKTTFLRLILQLIQPTRGDIYLFGQELRQHSLALRKRIGYAPALLRTNEHQTGLALLQTLAGPRKTARLELALQLADEFGLDLNRPIHQLSRGEHQQLNLAQACLGNPELLLLDEPTHALTPDDRHTFYQAIYTLRQAGHTILLATQSLAEIERTCDRVAVLDGGRMVSLERVVHFKAHVLREVEIRFAEQVPLETFARIPNLANLCLDRTTLRCTVKGNPDQLIKAAGQYHVVDLVCGTGSLENLVRTYSVSDSCAA